MIIGKPKKSAIHGLFEGSKKSKNIDLNLGNPKIKYKSNNYVKIYLLNKFYRTQNKPWV